MQACALSWLAKSSQFKVSPPHAHVPAEETLVEWVGKMKMNVLVGVAVCSMIAEGGLVRVGRINGVSEACGWTCILMIVFEGLIMLSDVVAVA